MDSIWVGLGTMLGTWCLTFFGGKRVAHKLEADVASLRADLDVVMEHLGLRVKGTKNGATAELGLASREVLGDPAARPRKER